MLRFEGRWSVTVLGEGADVLNCAKCRGNLYELNRSEEIWYEAAFV
jgi:hypothetical protein